MRGLAVHSPRSLYRHRVLVRFGLGQRRFFRGAFCFVACGRLQYGHQGEDLLPGFRQGSGHVIRPGRPEAFACLLNVLLLKMATDWFLGREIGTALALLATSWPVGIGIALIVLPWIAITYSVPSAFLITAVAAAVVLVLVASIYRPPENAVVPEGGSSFRLSWSEKGLVSLAGAVWALFNVGCIIVLSFTPSLLSAQGISARDAGVATSFASWMLISTMVLGGILLDRIGYATALMMTSFAVLGLSMMLLPSASSFALIAFIGAVAGLPCAAMLVLPTQVLRPQSRAPGMGVFYTWYYVGMTLLTPVAGLARDLSGRPTTNSSEVAYRLAGQ